MWKMKYNRINIGVMGGSSFAEKMMIPSIKQLSDRFNLVAIASRSEAKAKSLAEKFSCDPVIGYQNLIDRKDIDTIYCPLPTGLHYKWGINILKNKKHLLIEKSLSTDLDSAKALIDLAQKLDLCILENFMFEYHDQHQYVHNLLRNNTIGKIRSFQSSFRFPPFASKDNIRYQKELGGGSLLDTGAYTVKIAQLILGHSLEAKSAILHIDKELKVDIFGSAFLENKNGIPAYLSFGFDNSYECNFEISGSTGIIRAERAFTAKPDFEPVITITTTEGTKTIKHPADNQYLKFFQTAYNSITNQTYSKYYFPQLNQATLIQNINKIASIYEY